jgi:cell division septation protein DedD
MRKIVKNVLAFSLAAAMVIQPLQFPIGNGQTTAKAAGIADSFPIPAANANGPVGATVPYTRYDSEAASIGGGAALATSTDWAKGNIASQASKQSYVRLPSNGSYAEWTMHTEGDGVCIRFTMPDTSDGMGQNGSLDVYVNGSKVQTIDLTSYFMWQYFGGGMPSDTNNGGTGCFAFDETHFKLNKRLKSGDKIRIQSTGGLEYGVDFLEIENVPEAIEQPDNSVSVEDYGASPDDGADDLAAFKQAVEDADSKNMDVYVPEGTWNLSGMWTIGCENMKITGAGIWYTNIQFTNDQAFGGGIAAGNSSYVADGYCKNLEFCHMYLNSNLRSRYGEMAVYKCFMDIFDGGSVIHDIWEEHFECGFWFGDYNGDTDYCDGVKVVNSRIRNNLADGVNFCQGTSEAAVYNCNIRNCGDDGLAMWNNSDRGAKDEVHNIFAYNTIDMVWRAGGIAIYGGNGHEIYNNYICDMFMASGIHLNTTFPGYAFRNTTKISFDNNYLVRCGTNSDSWSEDLSAIDIKQSVRNITFNNTQIYDSPFTAIRLLDNNCEGVVFNDTKIFGAGLSGQDVTFSCNSHSSLAIREPASSPVRFNNLEIRNVHPDTHGDNTTWPYWTDRQTPGNLNSSNVTFNNDAPYELPPEPPVVPTPAPNPIEVPAGTDLQVVGLAWANENGSYDIKEGDKVTFSMAVRNDSNVAIPNGATVTAKVSVDGKGAFSVSYKGGLGAGQTILLTPSSTWTATPGGHELVAEADPKDVIENESNENNNTYSKKFNAQAAPDRPYSYTVSAGRYDLAVANLTWNKDTISVGDKLTWTATIYNIGDRAVPAGQKLGIQFYVDGKFYPSPITWNDQYYDGLQPGESIQLTATGGNEGSSWTAAEGTHTITAWVDDSNVFGEANEGNNRLSKTVTVPFGGIQYLPANQVQTPDDLSNIELPTYAPQPTLAPQPTTAQSTTAQPTTAQPTTAQPTTIPEPSNVNDYDLVLAGISYPTEINKGDQVTFTALVQNASSDAAPLGAQVRFTVDGTTVDTKTTSAIAAGGSQRISATWTAAAGGHEVAVAIDPNNALSKEAPKTNNSKSKKFNVESAINTNYTQTNGADLFVTDISYFNLTTGEKNGSISAGDEIVWAANGVNAGTSTIGSGTKIGVQYQVDGQGWPANTFTWCDAFFGPLAGGEFHEFRANGGNASGADKNIWIATNGNHTIMAWIDDSALIGESNEGNNQTTKNFTVPYTAPQMIANPDTPDNLDNIPDPVQPTTAPQPTTAQPTTAEPTTKAPEPTTKAPEPTTVEPTTQEPTTGEEMPDPLVLDGGEEGGSSMIGVYTAPTSRNQPTDAYKYMGFASFLDMVPDKTYAEGNYKYLVMTYTGDITQLRYEFVRAGVAGDGSDDEKQGPFWFNPEGQTMYFVGYKNKETPLIGDNTTICIDLEASGVELDWYNSGVHMHCDEMLTHGNGEGYTISNAYLTKTPIEPEEEEYTVTLDGTVVATVEAGETYTFPTTANVGYYGDGKLYNSGSTYTVNGDVSFSSVNLRMSKTPNIKYVKPAGFRFSGKIVCSDEALFSSNAIVESGLLIAPNDYLSNGSELSMNSGVKYSKVVTSVWVNNVLGSFATSFDGIIAKNYERDFVSRGYMIVNYADGSRATLYSAVSTPTSVSELAYKTFRNKTVYNSLSEANKELILEYAGLN